MNDMNHFAAVGRLTADAKLAYTTNGSAILNFSIAVNRSKKQGDQWVDDASFFTCKAFGKMAEAVNPYFKKGQQIAIEGYMKQERWEDQEGVHQSRVVLCADNVQLVGGHRDNSNGGYEPNYNSYGA